MKIQVLMWTSYDTEKANMIPALESFKVMSLKGHGLSGPDDERPKINSKLSLYRSIAGKIKIFPRTEHLQLYSFTS